MSRKTRKLIWSVPLVATLAIVGALAVFGDVGHPTGYSPDAAPGATTITSVAPVADDLSTMDAGSEGRTAIKIDLGAHPTVGDGRSLNHRATAIDVCRGDRQARCGMFHAMANTQQHAPPATPSIREYKVQHRSGDDACTTASLRLSSTELAMVSVSAKPVRPRTDAPVHARPDQVKPFEAGLRTEPTEDRYLNLDPLAGRRREDDHPGILASRV